MFFKQKTAYEMRISDWSSDVCSSDLIAAANAVQDRQRRALRHAAKRKRLRPGGDEEVAATRRGQPPAHFNSAKAIAVGLYPGPATRSPALDRKSVVSGKSVSVRVDLGGPRILQKKKILKDKHK